MGVLCAGGARVCDMVRGTLCVVRQNNNGIPLFQCVDEAAGRGTSIALKGKQ